MLTPSDLSDDQTTQQNGTSLQQPRTDLQQTNSTPQSNQPSTPQSSPSITQDQLQTNSLRVGDTGHTIQNTTSTPSNLYYHHDYLNAAWLWLLVPLVLAALLFWPQKKAPNAASISTKPERPTEPTKVVANEKSEPAKAEKPKKKSKKKISKGSRKK